MDKENLLVKGLSELGLTITEEQIEKFDKYYEMLIETNKIMNLTSITEYDEVIIKHFIDSLLVVNIFDINQSKKMIDVGTGAGFPGIPIKIMFPHLQITLLDSLNKRLNFLNNVIDEWTERRSYLILYNFHFSLLTDYLFSVLDSLASTDVETYGSIELQRVTSGGCFGVTEHYTDFFAELVDEDTGCTGLAYGGCQLTQRL